MDQDYLNKLPPETRESIRIGTVQCEGMPNGYRCMVMIPVTKESKLCYGCERDSWRMKLIVHG